MKNYNLLDEEITEKIIRVNIYADEIKFKQSPTTKQNWHYIGILVENIDKPILDDIIKKRFCDNFDTKSKYYDKNNKEIHWVDIKSADEANITERWFRYILKNEKIYFYLLGINMSKINEEEFGEKNIFNAVYNRFFRSGIVYALKTFFGDSKIEVVNIYHEQGEQYNHKYFPWHSIAQIAKEHPEISFQCKEITFISKDHKVEPKSNIIQLVDSLMGACVNVIDGVEKDSKRAKIKKKLIDIILDTVKIATNNKTDRTDNWTRKHFLLRFFPKKKTSKDDIERLTSNFYIKRKLHYLPDSPELF